VGHNESRWQYELSATSDERLASLTTRRTFEEVTALVTQSFRVLCCHRSEISGTFFRRPVYTLEVDPSVFDVFFNSQDGYRAAYYRSPGLGVDASVSFMRTVAPRLVGDPLSSNSDLSQEFLRESLSTPSAKIWLAEHGKEIEQECHGCKGQWSIAGLPKNAEIRNGRWEVATEQKAKWGTAAPYLNKLRIMGAFLDNRYGEYVPFDKRFRARDIYRYGWS